MKVFQQWQIQKNLRENHTITIFYLVLPVGKRKRKVDKYASKRLEEEK